MGGQRCGRWRGRLGLIAVQRTVRHSALLAGVCSLLAVTATGRAAESKPASPDSEFLEYLGSGDDVDPELQEYLAKPDGAAAADVKPAPKRGSDAT